MNVEPRTEKRLRILQLNKRYYPAIGGIEHIVQQIAEGLSEQTEMNVLVCSEDIHYKQETINGVTIIRLPKLIQWGSLPIPIGLISVLRKMCKELDIIHLHMPFPIGDIACLLSGFQGKIVLWWHSDIVRQKKLMYFYKPIMVRMLKRADVIIVATQGQIEHSTYLKQFKEKCIVIPFGVDKKIEQVADLYIETKKFPANNYRLVRFLFVGRLVYYKGCDFLLKSFAPIENAELVVVGTGKLEKKCKELVKELEIEHKVSFYGALPEEQLYQEFAKCDVFVLPSIAKSEAFGLVQIEAMSFGKPIINTNLPSGVPYVSIHGETGITIPPENIEELTKAMQWMVEHKEERLQMGKKARERMKAEYRLETMLERVWNVYTKLVEE